MALPLINLSSWTRSPVEAYAFVSIPCHEGYLSLGIDSLDKFPR